MENDKEQTNCNLPKAIYEGLEEKVNEKLKYVNYVTGIMGDSKLSEMLSILGINQRNSYYFNVENGYGKGYIYFYPKKSRIEFIAYKNTKDGWDKMIRTNDKAEDFINILQHKLGIGYDQFRGLLEGTLERVYGPLKNK